MGNKQANPKSVGGKALIPIPNCIRSRILWAVGEAERLKGSPPHNPEVVVTFQMNYTNWIGRGYIIVLLQNIFREDLIYADKEFTVWSLCGPDGSEARKTLETFSEKFLRLYPGYQLERYGHIVAKPETPVLNLKLLEALFRSKDEDLWQRSKWVFEA